MSVPRRIVSMCPFSLSTDMLTTMPHWIWILLLTLAKIGYSKDTGCQSIWPMHSWRATLESVPMRGY